MSWRKLVLAVGTVFLSGTLTLAATKKKVLLVGQGPDGQHPKGTHEYQAGVRILAKCLARVPNLEVTIVQADGTWKEGPDLLSRADAVVLFVAEGAKWIHDDPARRKAFEKLAARRAGIVGLHWAIGTRDARPSDGFLALLGACHGGPDRKYKVLEAEAEIADAKHPVTTGISSFRVRDEFYYRLKVVKAEKRVQPLVRVSIDGNKEMVAWAWERQGGGRSFGLSGLHFHDNWKLAAYRRLVAQGVLWTLKISIPKQGLVVDVPKAEMNLK
jgi:type 1 glutamine amidotransferase